MNKFRIVDTRFRILKGGKIGLAMSVALIGGMLSLGTTSADANDYTVTTNDVNFVITDTGGGASSTGVVTYGNSVSDTDYGILLRSTSNTLTNTHISNDGSVNVTTGTADFGPGVDVSVGIGTGTAYNDLHNLAGSTSIDNKRDATITVDHSTNAIDSVAFGILANYVYGTASITNSGNINVGSTTSDAGVDYDSSAFGINLTRLDQEASVVNSDTGRIDVTSQGVNSSYVAGIRITEDINIAPADMYDNTVITNAGTIDVTANSYYNEAYATGIDINNITGKNVTITNSGSIIVYADSYTNDYSSATGISIGSDLSGQTKIVGDEGDITVTSEDNSVGININGDLDTNASISSNDMDITTTDNGSNAEGIYVDDSMSGTTQISTVGTMNVTANGIDSQASGIHIDNGMYDDASILNSGIMNITANDNYWSDAIGIYTDSLEENASITNSGTITVSAADWATGIENNGDNDIDGTARIINEENMTVTSISTDATGIDNQADMYDSALIANYGSIIVDANQTAEGISTRFMYDSSSIDTNGSITVTSITDDATGIVAYSMYGYTHITNSGSIVVDANQTATGISANDMYSSSSIDTNGSITVSSIATNATGIDVNDMENYASITNSGTITVDANLTAMGITATTMIDDANITNTENGSITVTSIAGNATAISVNSMQDFAIVTNAGTITVDANHTGTGISANTMIEDTVIANSGSITVDAYLTAKGIAAMTMSDDANITNSGTMNVTATETADSNATGIFVVSLVDNASITNTITGSIDVNATDIAYGVYIGEDDGLGADMNDTAKITNAGNITVTSLTTDATGIFVDVNMTDSAKIANSGNIVVLAEETAKGIKVNNMLDDANITNATDANITVTSMSDSAYGIEASDMNATASITNLGNITVSSMSDSAYGINVEDMSDNANITNALSGKITVTSTNYAYGIDVNSLVDAASIVNAGDINVTANYDAHGVYVNNDMNATASITNSGNITVTSNDGDAYGVYIDEDMLDNATITNLGNITVDAEYNAAGISVDLAMYDDTNITNAADANITVTSGNDDADGIEVDDMNATASITNLGNISVDANYNAKGIDSDRMEDDASITNSGNIVVVAVETAIGISANEMSNNTNITNTSTGKITVTSTGVSDGAYGIDVDYLVDAASIVNAGDINVTADNNAYGIYNDGEQDMNATASITNSGNIKVTSYSDSATGIYVNADMLDNATITNSGDIIVEAYGYAAGITVDGMFDDANITTSGNIVVTSFDGDAYGVSTSSMDKNATINILADANVTVDSSYGNAYALSITDGNGTINNDGNVTATVAGEMSKDGYSVYSSGTALSDADRLTLNNTGTLSGNIRAANLVLENDGTVILPYDAMGEDAAVVDTFTQTADGILRIGVKNVDGDIVHSQLTAQDITLADGSTIDVNVMSADDEILLGDADSRLFGVLQASDTLDVDVDAINVTDNSYLLKFDAVLDDANSSKMDLAILSDNQIVDAVDLEEAVQSSGTAGALDTIINDRAYSELTDVIAALNDLGDAASVATAVNQLTPVAAVTASAANAQTLGALTNVVQARQEYKAGKNSGDSLFGEKNVWIKPFGSLATQDEKDGYHGYEVTTGGVGLGFDGEITSTQNIGLALFYTGSDVDVTNLDQSTQIKSYSALLYGDIGIIDDTTKLYYQAGYGSQNYDSQRAITFMGSNAKASYSGNTAMAMLKVAKDVEVSKSLNAIVGLKTLYANYETDAYKETALAEAQSVDASSKAEFIGGIEADFVYAMTKSVDLLTRAGVSYDFLNERDVVTSSFLGQPNYAFDTNSMELSPLSYQLGAGVAMDLSNNFGLNVMYDFDGRDSTYQNHTLSTKLNWKF